MKIKELPESERPRERLISKGAFYLSDTELLAIILKSGTNDMSVKEIGELLLKKHHNLQNIKNISYHELLQIKGIGPAKACQLLAAIELARRIDTKQDRIINIQISSARIVFEYYKNIVNPFQEQFYCLYLDSNKFVLHEKLLFVGTVNRSLVHPRDIFKEAYQVNATAIICVHNHPGGNSSPSKEDISVTCRLNQIGILMGIKLVDHVIITDETYYSFLENGKI